MRPKQETLAAAGFEKYRKATRREQFLGEMNTVVPWEKLIALIEPMYPKGEGAGRPPVGLERMLRIHFLQHWFNLSDPAVEEALCDSKVMREFVGIDLGREPAPDEATICKFRHLAGGVRAGATDPGCGESATGREGLQGDDGDDRGCNDHQRPVLDQEPERATRS